MGNEILDQESSNGTFQIDPDAHDKAKRDGEYKDTDLSEAPEVDDSEPVVPADETDTETETETEEEVVETADEEVEEDGEEDDSEVGDVEKMFDAWSVEFQESGVLSAESRQAVTDSIFADNVPDEIKQQLIESYEGGLNQIRVANTQEAFAIAGGEEGYSQMVKWAETALDSNEIEVFEHAVTGENIGLRDTAIKGLYARMQQAIGSDPNFEPDLAHSGSTGGGEPLIASRHELVKLQRTDEYKKDPTYRAKVARMLEQSMDTGKYQS
jgi:hypothetical protein